MIRVLFVCLGNICRSPMAEGIFNEKIEKMGLSDQITADSAGTSNYHIGSQPDPRTLETLKSHDIDHRHAARQVISADSKKFDYIVAMDQHNHRDLRDLLPSDFDGLYLMRSFDALDEGADVPDPYYGGQQGFENVYRILDRSIDSFLDHIRKEHHL